MSQPSDASPVLQTVRTELSMQGADEVPPYVEPTPISEIVVDGLASVSIINGQVRLTFYADRQSFANNKMERPIVARFSLTPITANLISKTLENIINKLITDNMIPPLPPVELR